jgi:cytochrome oxidase Cu insertion factor (SCO1/SenC/PrrC family)
MDGRAAGERKETTVAAKAHSTAALTARPRLKPAERVALGIFAAILVITASWWAAALWPLPAGTPDWVVRARAACFGVSHSGLPHAGGWIMLVGTPLSLLAALVVVSGGALRSGMRRTLATTRGRFAAVVACAAFAAVMVMSGVRAAGAAGWDPVGSALASAGGSPLGLGTGHASDDAPVTLRAIDLPPGELGLRDHRGERIELQRFAGAPLIVTFAFGRCETICPIIVHETLAARSAFGEAAPPLVIITVGPWRDAPPRLPHIAEMWGLDANAHLLGGEVGEVERVLDSWRVNRVRDTRTGDISHPSLVYIVDADGRIRHAVPGGRGAIEAALRSL